MAELVFDVGMHDGNDTAYYLASGYDVVAVEANPSLCAAARRRFADEIAAGRLTVCNVGIADQAGDLDFWVSDRSEWSSFYEENAKKAGVSASCIVVPTMRFADLLNEYPAALCVKIDIEGNDTLCIRELERCSSLPSYVSVELPTYVLEGDDSVTTIIQLLTKLGYQAFRCVRQNDWREITPSNMRWQGRMRKIVARADSFQPVLGIVLRRLHYRKRRMKGWRFVVGNSGPLPSQFPGRWMKYAETLAVCQALGALDRELNAGGLGEWFDIHAVRG
jgi:FkbM family methyltransferase